LRASLSKTIGSHQAENFPKRIGPGFRTGAFCFSLVFDAATADPEMELLPSVALYQSPSED
jgi:hypothetical protein